MSNNPCAVEQRVSIAKLGDPANSALLESLRKAYTEMPLTKPTGLAADWLNLQGKLHEWYCNPQKPKYALYPGATAFTDAHTDHRVFLLWHRGVVYFHDRLLKKLCGDNKVRTPLWDWDLGELRSFQTRFGVQRPFCAPDSFQFGPELESFFAIHRKAAEKAVEPTCFSDFSDALGAPHGNMHYLAGGTMSNFLKAAWDPLFYSHHAKCDWYLSRWQSMGLAITANLAEQESKFYFYDENLKLRWMKAADLYDISKLGYSYDLPHPPPAPQEFISSADLLMHGHSLNGDILSAAKRGDSVWVDLGQMTKGRKGPVQVAVYARSDGANSPRHLLGIVPHPAAHNHDGHSVPSLFVHASEALSKLAESSAVSIKIEAQEIDTKGKSKKLRAKPAVSLPVRIYRAKPRP